MLMNKQNFPLITSGIVTTAITLLRAFVNQRLQVKFKDRDAAGKMLGDIIRDEIKKIRLLNEDNGKHHELVIVGIPRGGVVTALAVARKLSATLDIVVARRLLAPYNEELTIGAVTNDLVLYLNQDVVDGLNISRDYIETETTKQSEEIKSRISRYRLHNAGNLEYDMRRATVVLVDDGAASGATLIAALRYVKTRNPQYLIVGVPIASKQTMSLIRKEADKVLCIFTPSNESFRSVEQFYVDFVPITDNQVADALGTRTYYE